MPPDPTSPHAAAAPATSPSALPSGGIPITETPGTVIPPATVEAILQALSGLRYGQVTVIVQDGRVMQIERTDRLRLPAAVAASTSEPRPGGTK